jgi:hypothetical protein
MKIAHLVIIDMIDLPLAEDLIHLQEEAEIRRIIDEWIKNLPSYMANFTPPDPLIDYELRLFGDHIRIYLDSQKQQNEKILNDKLC